MSQPIITDTAGLIAGDVSIPASDFLIPAYRAMPAEGASLPVALVIQEIFGINEYIRDVCRRLAKVGYLAIAPSLFDRQGDVSKISDIPQIMSQIVSKVPDAQVLTDLDATVSWASGHNGDISRLAMTGFCWGGRITWLYAAHTSRLKAGAAWYGRLAGNRNELTPAHPLDLADELKASVIGFYGGQDHGIPLDTVETMRAAIPSPSQIVVYDDAGHAFHADYRPAYNEAAARHAWPKMLAFFKENGAS